MRGVILKEPKIIAAKVKDSYTDLTCEVECFDIVCYFDTGEKYSCIQIDGEFPELANRIAEWLNKKE